MEFTSSFDQTNFMGYCPPPQNDSCYYANGGWEYHQEMIEYEQSIDAPGPLSDQNMRYFPPPQYDLCHDPKGGWEYQQGMMEYEHLPQTQNEPYSDESNNYSCCSWEGQNQRALNSPYSTYQEPSSLEQTFNAFMQNCPTSLPSFSIENYSSLEYTSTQNSFQNPHDSIHQPQQSFHNYKIHSISLNTTSPQHIHVTKITLNLHLLS
ncbi:hypothetical protein AHAS_Ahas11G0320200 [Arachis hypogaea]